jgi:hypothetical protein
MRIKCIADRALCVHAVLDELHGGGQRWAVVGDPVRRRRLLGQCRGEHRANGNAKDDAQDSHQNPSLLKFVLVVSVADRRLAVLSCAVLAGL